MDDEIQAHKDYEKALMFLTENLRKSGNSPKPVGIHSVLVATRLYRYGCPKHVVLAALLHDVVEDSDVTIDQVRSEFGELVAGLVELMTRDTPEMRKASFAIRRASFDEHLEKLLKAGPEALAISAADFIENCPFYKYADSPELKDYLKWKHEKFIKRTEPFLKNSPLWPELIEVYKELVKSLT